MPVFTYRRFRILLWPTQADPYASPGVAYRPFCNRGLQCRPQSHLAVDQLMGSLVLAVTAGKESLELAQGQHSKEWR